MRIYSENKELEQVICNMCNKNLLVENGIVKEGFCSIDQHFGYFSTRDGIVEKYDLCEECYNQIKKQFLIPVEVEEIKEYL